MDILTVYLRLRYPLVGIAFLCEFPPFGRLGPNNA